MMRDVSAGFPSFPAIRGAAQMNLDLAPVGAAVLPRLRIRQRRAFRRDDDAGDAIPRDAVHACGKDVGLFEKRFDGMQRGERSQQQGGEEYEAVFHEVISDRTWCS